ncbi:ABC transporter ATP-binding protein [Sulfitobacter sp. D35]|uniref:ABC transporter ATP-binding protein n=1 Tax=Sulfitobacter sp. D35 TaxID=3083252 RepID=UPI00296F0607|nr:ABC transporter ATP-binding protein [Sulfitobacter sp. D35]MDW4500334.1 ABC transporter ATP-binding protein [Sulfitobacter sp. D35]
MITVEHASVSFGGLRALRDVSFDITSGRITGLIGPNGAGKTTMFNAIAGHVPLNSGRVLLEGRDITRLPPHARAQMGLARTFQLPQEFRRLTVLENLMAAAAMPRGESVLNVVFRRGAYAQEERAAFDAACEIMDLLEIAHVEREAAGNLSGGQKKLLELGRALMRKPRVVLLDEIGAGINRTLLAKIAEKIRMLNTDQGLTFCLIEHDLAYVRSLCDEAIVLVQGEVLVRGDVDTVEADERVIEAYFGGGKYEAAQ